MRSSHGVLCIIIFKRSNKQIHLGLHKGWQKKVNEMHAIYQLENEMMSRNDGIWRYYDHIKCVTIFVSG